MRKDMALPNSTNIKIELLRLGLSQAQVAEQLRISRQYMCDIVQGRRAPQKIIARLIGEIGLPVQLFSDAA